MTAWLLVILDSYLFFDVIIPFGPPIHTLGSFTVIALLKVGLTFSLALLWFFVIISLTQLYVRSRLNRPLPSASS